MNSEQYWQKRAKEREDKWLNKSKKEIEQEIKKLYVRALRNIQKDINDLYERFADENGLSMAEAKKLITGNEYSIWRMDIEEYVEKSATKREIKKELNTLAMKSRISRLDKLYGDILMELLKMSDGYDSKLTDYLKTALTDNYYQTYFDICKGINILMPVSILDPDVIEDIIRTPWSGKQFSKRIWNNTTKLAKVLKTEISNAMTRGVNAREISSVISKKMDSGYKQAITLVRSELNYVNNQSSLKSIKEAGGEEYRFIATLDRRTSEKCRKLDNTIHKVDEGIPGSNMPPMHPRCRSTISITNLTASSVRKRISRVNGEIKYVPADMNYSDWEKIYIRKSMTLNEWSQNYQVEKISKEFSKQLEKLTTEEKNTVTKYTGFGAERINGAIMGKRKLNDSIKKEIRLLDSALSKGIVPEDIIVIRKTIPENMNLFQKDEKITLEKMQSIVGRKPINPNFTSTAMKEFDYKGRNVVITLKVPKGYKGALYIQNIAISKYKNQYEVLFHRNMQYIINSVNYKNGIYYITAEVINNAR